MKRQPLLIRQIWARHCMRLLEYYISLGVSDIDAILLMLNHKQSGLINQQLRDWVPPQDSLHPLDC